MDDLLAEEAKALGLEGFEGLVILDDVPISQCFIIM